MKRGITAVIAILLILTLAAPARRAWAGIHQVWDEAHFFKVDAIQQVDKIADEIHGRLAKDLMVETFASIPDDLKPTLQQQGKEQFFEGWANSEGHELGINGVLILITGEPAHLQVAVGRETRQKAFTDADRAELVQQLAGAFRQKDFDAGITQAAQFVRDRMSRNLGGGGGGGGPATTRPTTRPSDGAAAASRPEAREAPAPPPPQINK